MGHVATGVRAGGVRWVWFRERRRQKLRRRLVSLYSVGGECLASRVRVARTVLSRFVGLLARNGLASDEGLLLVPGGAIHTFGMRFPIDVIFLDAEFRVAAFCRRVQPCRIALAPPRTAFVLELPAGRIDALRLEAKQRLVLRATARSRTAEEKHAQPDRGERRYENDPTDGRIEGHL